MPSNINMNPLEQVIQNDVLRLIQTNATTLSIGRGVPTAAALLTSVSMPVTEVVLTYPDGRKFNIQVDVRQINTNAGRV
jgi:ABC-type glucose/galactose transport system permease subunit